MASHGEPRIDPADGQPYTLEEMRRKYDGHLEGPELDFYFRDKCAPAPKAFTDASSQTAAASQVPLPLQYPANLIYAQNMLAISLSQLQRVDLTIAQLRFHLREHQLRAATAELQAALGLRPEAWTAASEAPAAPNAAAAPDAPQGDAGAPARPAAEGAGAALERFPLHRQRLAAVIKGVFIMFLLEVQVGWYFVYFFAVFLYIGGVFDPFIDWFRNRPAQVTLEQQLTQLRNRQNAPPQAPPPAAPPAPDPAQTEGQDAADGNGGALGEGGGSSSSTGNPREPSAEAGTEAPADGLPATGDDADFIGSAADTPPPPQEELLPYWHRFVYQLVVMFFMTLLPWWNPDPRYLMRDP